MVVPEYTICFMKQPALGRQAKVYQTSMEDPSLVEVMPLNKTHLNDHINTIRVTACFGRLSPKYISDSIGRNTITIVQYLKVNKEVNVRGSRHAPASKRIEPTLEPHGFVLARPDNTDPSGHTVYLDIICSMGPMAKLLKYFFDWALTNDYPNIRLSSLPNVLSYYPKFGFKFRESCSTPVVKELPESIQHRNPREKPFPQDHFEAADDDDYADFMTDLHALGLSAKKTGVCAATRKLSKAELKSGNCGEDGYTMVRCKDDVDAMASNAKRIAALEAQAIEGLLRIRGTPDGGTRKHSRKTRKYKN